jgi:hypothetical protein
MWRPERRGRARRARDSALVEGASAFLSGGYAEHLAGSGNPVPVWAWTNLLAHADAPTLAAEADAARACSDPWRRTRGLLAGELLAELTSSCSLEEVQSAVLRPLELRLAERQVAGRWSHRTWAEAVRQALAEHRRSTHRS